MSASEVEAQIRQDMKEVSSLHSWKVLDVVCNVLSEAKSVLLLTSVMITTYFTFAKATRIQLCTVQYQLNVSRYA